MMDKDSHDDEIRMYGPWTWIAGMAFGTGIVFVMFALSDGFS